MFGPLPQLHRLVVILTALAVGILSGIWLARLVDGIPVVAGGLGWGLLAGLLLNFLLLHDFQHGPHAARVRRH